MATVNKIFVYGTLMNGFLKDIFPGTDLHIKASTPGTISGLLFDLGDYPGAKPAFEAESLITGEMHEIEATQAEKILLLLDEYEGYDAASPAASLYRREITSVKTAAGITVEAWVYWYNGDCEGKTEIKEGDYYTYLKRNK